MIDRDPPRAACLDDEQLAAWASGEIAAAERGVCLAHVEACAACGAVLQELGGGGGDEPVQLGRYLLHGALGAGGMGMVFRGHDPALGRDVAIKVIVNPRQDADGRAALLREARALAAVRHRNVVTVHDVGEADGEVFIAMEHASGMPLGRWWRGQSLVARGRVLDDVAAGLAAIHAAALVHRDVKPANIIVSPAGEGLVVDLGLADPAPSGEGSVDGAPATTLAAGTPGYVAPELLRGAAATPQSDEFAYWRVVAETLADAPLSRRQRAAVARVVARGTQDDPAARFGSMARAAAALTAALHPARHRRAAWLGVAVLAVGVAVGLAWWSRPMPAQACTARLEGWDPVRRAEVVALVAAEGLDEARLVAFVDREHRTGEAIAATACRQAVHTQGVAQARATRQQLCVAQVWQQRLVDLAALRRPAARRAAIDDMGSALPLSRCAEASPPSTPAPPPDAIAPQVRLLFERLDRRGDTDAAAPLAALAALRAEVEALAYPPLHAAWHHQQAYWLMRAGRPAEARAAAAAAARAAQGAGDDQRYAVARLAELIAANALAEDVLDLERDVEAAVQRVGSPGLRADFEVTIAAIRVREARIEAARDLLLDATATLEGLALAPHARLVAAQQNLAVSYQYLGDLGSAQRWFDAAYQNARDRWGATALETLDVRLARASNLLYRGEQDEAAGEVAALQAALDQQGAAPSELRYRLAIMACQLAMQRTDDDAAEATCATAVTIAEAMYGPDGAPVLAALNQLGQAQLARAPRRAVPTLERAVALAAVHRLNPNDEPYARGLLALAYALVDRKAEGLREARLALPELHRLNQPDLAALLETTFPRLREAPRPVSPRR